MDNKKIGCKYEHIAKDYLIKHEYSILISNYTYKHCEIDIIALKKDKIHFIEVKFRSNSDYGYPESFVSIAQQGRIKCAAEQFLYENNLDNNIVFDIIAIDNNEIKIFSDAF